ncbi:hypothetical protein ACFP3U_36285 [Kitasatospora misakiensis]|uniref:Transposase n=1 Tax=Kitasatospora misakiensis TaxID=67330 RepID=A0ABW0XH14_9ACTN
MFEHTDELLRSPLRNNRPFVHNRSGEEPYVDLVAIWCVLFR